MQQLCYIPQPNIVLSYVFACRVCEQIQGKEDSLFELFDVGEGELPGPDDGRIPLDDPCWRVSPSFAVSPLIEDFPMILFRGFREGLMLRAPWCGYQQSLHTYIEHSPKSWSGYHQNILARTKESNLQLIQEFKRLTAESQKFFFWQSLRGLACAVEWQVTFPREPFSAFCGLSLDERNSYLPRSFVRVYSMFPQLQVCRDVGVPGAVEDAFPARPTLGNHELPMNQNHVNPLSAYRLI